jgi:hypothetical protein
MDYKKVENCYSDYIISLVGPNEELDRQREEKFIKIKELILSAFEKESCEYIPHIYCFGSFPLKMYLQDSDLDITIMFEDKEKGTYITSFSFDFINRVLNLIQTCFENFNVEMKTPVFTDINLIFADVKLLKCKYGNLPIDISINNYVGLSKLVFMNYVENIFLKKLSMQNKDLFLFKKTLILVKAWCYYEGFILGSNISLMASYALEILVIYLFNNYHQEFSSEVEAFFYFFKMMQEIDFDSYIIQIFGKMSIEEFYEKQKNESTIELTSLSKENNNYMLDYNDLCTFIKNYDKLREIDKNQNQITKKSFVIKYVNIIDPMFCYNNLGKSINFHNYTKIKKVIEFVYKDVQEIIAMRSLNDPFKYLNSLLKLFSKTLTNANSELFFFSLPIPKIIISPYTNTQEDETLSKNVSTQRQQQFNQQKGNLINNTFSSLNEKLINEFNSVFLPKNDSEPLSFLTISSNINKNEECKFNQDNNNLLYVTKDIINFMLSRLKENNNDENQTNNQAYTYPTYYETQIIEGVLKNL